ncbi:MAG TPA: amidohydrolase [Candidatus Aminicenantes bacterium]|nr:amidohydrolase [Candidatus Aminicenantes bacterium]
MSERTIVLAGAALALVLASAGASAPPGPGARAGTAAEAGVTAVVGARVLTGAGAEYGNGVVLIEGGRIKAVGPAASVPVPAGAEVFDASGRVVTPGLVDSHSHLGLGPSGGVTEDNEMSDPVTPELRIIDSIHPEGEGPDERQFRRALAEGVTAVAARPGSGNVVGGQSAVLKLRGGTVDDMVILFPADMKMALGRKGFYSSKGVMPTTKMGAAYLVRKALVEAAEYGEALERYERRKAGDPKASPPPRDLGKEAMLKVVRREIPVHIHVHSSDDIMTAVRLAEEFGFLRLSLGHAVEAYKVAGELARRGVAVVVGPQMIAYDDQGRLVNLAGYLADKGVRVDIMTDADVVQESFLRCQAAIAVKYGMDPRRALEAITLSPARTLGLEARIGSLEPGKDADLVVFDGDPFDVATRVLAVFIEGRRVYEYEAEAEGGGK